MKNIGYKVTDSNMQCRGFQYELGKQYTHKGSVEMCGSGFHFCLKTADCFNYYSFDPNNRVFEIEFGNNTIHGEDKSVTDTITFVKELSWSEVLVLVNSGKGNTGIRNSGDRNSGNWNSGDSNSGDSNSGNWNSGNWNSGDSNSGNRNSGNSNSGNSNSGNWNSGNRNSGDSNSGNWNSGNRNSGNRNSGYRNSGDRNSGNWNSGYRNSGNWNSGNWNSGDSNSGNWNSGNRNSGDSNSGYRNSGAFCTDPNPKLILFNKLTDINIKDWENNEVVRLMYNIEPTIWVPYSYMTEVEKINNPKAETTEGYLKSITMKDAWANFWNNLQDSKKKLFLDLPNFDAKIFEEITGIKTK